ncbi:hypothetical protein TrLO_g15775 [Triparma laevis f. longispina]|uniref:peptidylprolyl isomerase n=2 Tax=Triparma laevis TaxID=1534972 RepID=A0A9W7FET3_9STRA|nr:hypothetical protein TrLO_g15775 [Triparma laevis f. longispina]
MQPIFLPIILRALLLFSLLALSTCFGLTSPTVSRAAFLQTSAGSLLVSLVPSTSDDFTKDPRGFSYNVLEHGTPAPSPLQRGQSVSCDYTLTLDSFDGTKVDSSKGILGKPLSFPVGVGQVIKGWDLAIRDMAPGERRLIVIPPELGYGDKKMGGKIPASSTLFFDVTLVSVGKVPEFNQKQLEWLKEHPE